MSAPLWPDSLPCKLRRDGYSETLPDGRLRQAMSTGPAKVRHLTSAAVRTVQGSVHLTFDQKATLEAFVRDDLAKGVRAFWFRDESLDGMTLDAEEDGVSLGPMLTEDGEEILIDAWWLVRIGEGGVTVTRKSPKRWEASFALEVLP